MAYLVRLMKRLRKCIGTKCMMFFKTKACKDSPDSRLSDC